MFDGERDDPGPGAAPAAVADRAMQDRRMAQRHLAILRVGKIVTAKGEDLCLIRNISTGGLMARIYSRVEVGQHVLIELRANQRMTGVVRWTRDDCTGIQFDDPIDVAAILSDRRVKGEHRPRAPRLSRPCRATLRVGAHYHRVMVRDVSQGGVKIEAAAGLATGAEVILTMEGFRAVPGTIRWTRDGDAGIAFNQVIPYPELTAWLKDHRPD